MVRLPDDVQREYDELQEMFATPGWKGLIDGFKREIYQLQAAGFEHARNWGDLREMRGQAKHMAYMIHLEEVVDNEMQEARLAAEQEAEEADDGA
ncbi:MAG: hypothetical protein QNJ97_17820 [Myxococcota bacterium]|nr:hypothetical protein [Myxococcota bacterium]